MGVDGVAGFLAGSALLVLRPAAGWSVFAAVVGTVAWTQVSSAAILPKDVGFNIGLTVSTGLTTYGLTWMARTVRQLRAARQEQAEVALVETRVRFARDLHDLLGLSLSAITLKSEVTYRSVLPGPGPWRAGRGAGDLPARAGRRAVGGQRLPRDVAGGGVPDR